MIQEIIQKLIFQQNLKHKKLACIKNFSKIEDIFKTLFDIQTFLFSVKIFFKPFFFCVIFF